MNKNRLTLMVSLTCGSLVHAETLPPTEVSFTKHQLHPLYISEGASIGDLNNDGHPDVIAGPLWWAGPDFKAVHSYQPVKSYPLKGAKPMLANYAENFFSFPDELTGDEWGDLLLVGLPGKPATVVINPAKETFRADNTEQKAESYQAQKSVCHESPQYLNVIGNEQKELLFFHAQKIALAYPTETGKPWQAVFISPAVKPKKPYVHGLGAGDINGDGLQDILEKDGWWEQPKVWDRNTPWTFHPVPFAPGKGGAQMYAYDIDGDGDNDVVTALDAHGYGLVWYEQLKEGEKITFKQHPIMTDKAEGSPFGICFSQPHAMVCVDIDGDGIKDLITGKTYYAHLGKDPGAKDPAVIYWFKTHRNKDGTVTFLPYQIDNDSGIGRQISTADLNGDGKEDLVTSNKKGVFLFLQN